MTSRVGLLRRVAVWRHISKGVTADLAVGTGRDDLVVPLALLNDLVEGHTSPTGLADAHPLLVVRLAHVLKVAPDAVTTAAPLRRVARGCFASRPTRHTSRRQCSPQGKGVRATVQEARCRRRASRP